MNATSQPTARRPVELSTLGLLSLSFQTLGIIYSDIGTSPLYVLNGIWPSSGLVPSKEDVIGGISCIFWSLTLIPLLKYVFVALRFGTDEGEGGCFALYHGLIPPVHPSDEEDRTLTGDSYKAQSVVSICEKLLRFKWVLLPWTLFGTSLTMADGVFTPAVSITSAVGGIAVGAPSVAKDVIPISIAFLVVLFAAQRFGTTRLAVIFSPITVIWFGLIATTGVINITTFPGIFRAFDPSRAVLLFVRTKNYDILAGVLLAVTGCEALFANLGQFNMRSIQLSFGCLVYPSLVLAYLGQGSRLIVDGEHVLPNVFYRTIPGASTGPLFWIIYVFAILATLVASQAMITATFSLIQQVINMKSFPPLRMVYTSEKIQGQVYIPAVNWTLAVTTLIVVCAFKSSIALTNAYGFCVATVMFTTTTLLALQCRYIKHLPWVACGIFFLFFGFFDGLFFGAALKKIPRGAWVPLMLGSILVILMVLYTWGKSLEDAFDGANRQNLRHFIIASAVTMPNHEQEAIDGKHDVEIEENRTDGNPVSECSRQTLYLAPDANHASRKLAVLPILAIFHKFSGGKGVPHSFAGFLRQYPALPRFAIFLTVRMIPVARIPAGGKFVVSRVRSIDGFYGVTYRLGYREHFDVDVKAIIEDICNLECQARGINPSDSVDIIRELQDATKETTHIVSHYNIVSKRSDNPRYPHIVNSVINWIREVLIEDYYRRLGIMFPETANWLTPADEIIHVGVTARI